MMYTTSGDEGRLQRFDGTVASWLPDILQHNIGELDLLRTYYLASWYLLLRVQSRELEFRPIYLF